MTSADGSPSADSSSQPAPPSKVKAGQAAPEPVASGLSLLTAAVGAVVLSVLVATLDETYQAVQVGDGLARIDQPLLDWMVAHRTTALDATITLFTDIGSTKILPILTTLVVVGLAWWWRSWTPIALMAVAAAGSVAMTEAGKDLAGRARPPQRLSVPPYETTPSFPSGHTLNSTVIAIILVYLVLLHVRSRLGRTVTVALLAVYALAMGMSRVFLGHHWFTDVVAGFVAGTAWAIVVILAHRLLLRIQYQRAAQSTT
jgi:membrane-associated phospholipid phosphatase